MKTYSQDITFNTNKLLSIGEGMVEVIMNTFQTLYEGRNLCMFCRRKMFADGKGNHLEVTAIGEDELCNKFFKAIGHTLEKMIKPVCTFNPNKGWETKNCFEISSLKISNFG
jgi:hypothetical protein